MPVDLQRPADWMGAAEGGLFAFQLPLRYLAQMVLMEQT